MSDIRRFNLRAGYSRFETAVPGGLLMIEDGDVVETADAAVINACLSAPHSVAELDAKGRPLTDPPVSLADQIVEQAAAARRARLPEAV